MAKTLNSKYKVLDTYALRTPLFSLKELFNIYESDCTKTALWNLFENPTIKEAIYLASPNLYDQLILFKTNESRSTTKYLKLNLALLKYITRLCSRPTPFGLFAGTAMGVFSQNTSVILDSKKTHSRHTRLDFEFLAELAKTLTKNPSVRDDLIFYPNTSIYKSVDQLRYIEITFDKKRKNYSLQRIAVNDVHDLILKFTNQGQSYKALIDFVMTLGFEQQEATSYVDTLISFQVLISNLEPYTVGKDYTEYLIEALPRHLDHPSLAFLNTFKLVSAGLDKDIGNAVKTYKTLIKDAIKLNPTLKKDCFVQVDLYPSFIDNTISRNLKIDISRALNITSALFEPYYSEEMEDFVKTYYRRFGTQTLPLVNVLDLDYGIGYPVNSNKSKYPYLENLEFSENIGNQSKPVSLNRTELYLLKLIKKNPNKSLDLAMEDLSDFQVKDPNLNTSIYAMSELIIENKVSKLFLNSFGGSSISNILGRFSCGSNEIRAFLKEISEFEAFFYKDHIVAEIAHLPENRTGNILFRPQLRDFQINFLSGVNNDINGDINITDLMVSIKDNKVVIKSKKHEKPIIPYLSNAHNYLNSNLPMYRFLCDYQRHRCAIKVGFGWGQLSKLYSHLPRVSYKNIILSKEQWVFQNDGILNLFKKTLDDSSLMAAVGLWAKKEGLPQYVQLKQRDNLLLINFNSVLSVRMLLGAIPNKSDKTFTLLEFLHGRSAIVKDGQGESYTNEFVFALTKNNNGN